MSVSQRIHESITPCVSAAISCLISDNCKLRTNARMGLLDLCRCNEMGPAFVLGVAMDTTTESLSSSAPVVPLSLLQFAGASTEMFTVDGASQKHEILEKITTRWIVPSSR